jgi:hypothetical protein
MCTIICIVVISVLIILCLAVALGMFPSHTQLEQIKNGLWNRSLNKAYPTFDANDDKDRAAADRVIGYVERVIDRQINKARGILPFNSLVIAAFGFERTKLTPHLQIHNVDINVMLLFAMALLAASGIICLWLMLVRFGAAADYGSYTTELTGSLGVIKKRAVLLEIATVLSLWAVALGLALIASIEFLA